ncbi:unnamed protein product [Pedinophyceae sp. YPF-701]|nr:unnamed protein product [Pedinophyceae sp. YPF-701]
MESPPEQLEGFFAVLEGPLLPYLDRASRIQLAATSTGCFSAIARSRSALRPLRTDLDDIGDLFFLERTIKKDLQSLRVLSRCVRPGEPNCAGTIEFPQFSINAGDVHALLTALAASSPLDLAVLAGAGATPDEEIVALATVLQRAAAASTGPLRVHRLTLEDVDGPIIPAGYMEKIFGLPGLDGSLRELHIEGLKIDRDPDDSDSSWSGPEEEITHTIPSIDPIVHGAHPAAPSDASTYERGSDVLLSLLGRADGLTHVTLQSNAMPSEVWTRVLDALARHRRPLSQLHLKLDRDDRDAVAVETVARVATARRIDALRITGVQEVECAAGLLRGDTKAVSLTVHRGKLGTTVPRVRGGAEGQRAVWEALVTNGTTTHLDLSVCGIGDAGLLTAFPADAPRVNTALRSLRLGANHITLAGCAALARGFPALTHLDMEATPIGFRGVAALLNGLPSLKVAAFANLYGPIDGVEKVGEAIASNGTVEALKLGASWSSQDGNGSGVPFLLSGEGRRGQNHRFYAPGLADALGHGLARNKTLQRLHLEVFDFGYFGDGASVAQPLLEGLKRNATLRQLSLLSSGGVSVQELSHVAFALSELGSDATRNESSPPCQVSLHIPSISGSRARALQRNWQECVELALMLGPPSQHIATLHVSDECREEFRSQLPWDAYASDSDDDDSSSDDDDFDDDSSSYDDEYD